MEFQVPTEKWYEAIFKRHSRRQFDGRSLPIELLKHLVDFSQNLNANFQGVRAIVVTEQPDEIFKGAVGSYGKIKGAPAYVAFLGEMKDPHVQEKIGILGEFFILEATSLGLGTCWVGGFFKPDVVKEQIKLKPKEQIIAVSPVGFVKEQLTFEEKIMSKLASSHKRKDLLSLLISAPMMDPKLLWINTALEAARLAPSAVNRQPWRFSIENGTLKVSMDNPKNSAHVSKRLDCGIAMAHIEIAARHEGVTGYWEYLEGYDVARFRKMER